MADESFPYSTMRLYPRYPDTFDVEVRRIYDQQERPIRADCDAILKTLTPDNARVMAALAKTSLRKKDLARGFQAIALAVAVDPGNAEWRALLERYLDCVERNPSLFPDFAHPWFLFNPIRAYFAHRRGGLSEEIDFLLGSARTTGAAYVEYWILPLLDDATIRSLTTRNLAGIFGNMAETYPEHGDLNPRQSEHLARAAELVAKSIDIHSDSDQLKVIRLMFLGKLGRFAEAIREGKELHAVSPTWHTAIGVANAMKRSRDIDGAIEYFRKAARLDREDESALLEAGDLLLDRHNWAAALDAYERALARWRNHPWAAPSAAFCRYQLHHEKAELTRLRRMAKFSRDACGVGEVIAGFSGETPPSSKQHRARKLLARLEKP